MKRGCRNHWGMNGRLSPLQSDMKGKDSSDRPSEWIIPLRCQCNFIIQWAFEWVRCHTISLLENVLLCIIDQTNTSRLRLGNKGTVWQGVMLHVVSSSSFRLYVLIKCTEKNKQQSQISSSQFIYWINLDKKHQNLFFFLLFFNDTIRTSEADIPPCTTPLHETKKKKKKKRT